MKSVILWFSLLVIGVFNCSKAPLPTDPNQPGDPKIISPTKLKVTAIQEDSQNVDSAQVFINGKAVGFTPLEYQTEETGLVTIRVQKPHFQIYSQNILVPEQETVFIEALLKQVPNRKGQLLITVNQDSCHISVNDINGNLVYQTLGQETALVLESAGYFVKASKLGYQPSARATRVLTDSITIENIQLVPTNEYPAPEVWLSVPESVQVNQPVLVQWQTQNTTRIDIDYLENPGLNGKREIIFTTPGQRIISATGYNAYLATTVVETVMIYMPPAGVEQPPRLLFEVSPQIVTVGQPILLKWKTNGYQVILDQGVGSRGAEGQEEVSFNNSGKRIFTAIAYARNGLTTIGRDSVYVRSGPNNLPTISLQVSERVVVGSPVLIEWQSTNASQVEVDFLGAVSLNGKAEHIFTTPGRRVIAATAYNTHGQKTVQDTVEVYQTTTQTFSVTCDQAVAAYHESLPQKIEVAAQIKLEQAGRYQVIARVDFNSGDAQKNESCLIAVRNADGTIRWPVDPNAGPYRVIVDEPGAAHVSECNAGSFYFSAGVNTLQIWHYVTIADQYPQFAIAPPITGAESVRVLNFELKYLGH